MGVVLKLSCSFTPTTAKYVVKLAKTGLPGSKAQNSLKVKCSEICYKFASSLGCHVKSTIPVFPEIPCSMLATD